MLVTRCCTVMMGARILLCAVSRAAQYRIDREARDAGDILYLAGELAADARSEHGFRSEISRRGVGAGGLGGLSECQQVDNVGGRKRGVGGVGCAQTLQRALQAQADVVLVDRGGGREIDHGFGLHRVDEIQRAGLQNITVSEGDNVSAD